MKILKKGILPSSYQEYKGSCKVCGCEVEATSDDPELKSGYSGIDAQHGFYVMCPTKGCNRQIDMEKVVYRSRV
jgi:Na+-transporting NADH:ubiquinone oxidoreductase subunit NqrF